MFMFMMLCSIKCHDCGYLWNNWTSFLNAVKKKLGEKDGEREQESEREREREIIQIFNFIIINSFIQLFPVLFALFLLFVSTYWYKKIPNVCKCIAFRFRQYCR